MSMSMSQREAEHNADGTTLPRWATLVSGAYRDEVADAGLPGCGQAAGIFAMISSMLICCAF